MATAHLFNVDDLCELVDEDLSDERFAVVEKVVWGWVSDALGIDTRPDPLPPALEGWSLELGANFHENPGGLAEYQLGEERSKFSAERRRELLELVAASGNGGATPSTYAGGPRLTGRKLCEPYPDPARGRGYGGRLREPSGY